MLGEGNTPLVKSRRIGKALGLENLYFKLENLNPTGSYKDRFAAVLVSEMVAAGQKFCIATSSGNTGAALSAYCAAAGITCVIFVVDGAPSSKIRQMQLYGAHIRLVKGFGLDPLVTAKVFGILEKYCAANKLPLPVSAYRYCPSAMRGVETLALELKDSTIANIDHIFAPAGGGGLTLAVTKGVISSGANSKVHCVQPRGNDTITSPLRDHASMARAVAASTTRISGLQVPSVLDGNQVIENCRALGGNGYVVSDESVFSWQKRLATQEGIFCEPAGAVALAGLEDALLRNEVSPRNETVVCLITGSGFKDMENVHQNFQLTEPQTIEETKISREIEVLNQH
ncbi:threonine synthase [Persicitalea jodogahamensis]|uniref:Threonine synthase n=1 Tax=Persicitalea jodogahamensis TaxID=402147 RepID=A0A8J3G9P1_9BACT|nr:threonine synthase [Persicitalea jodogahamensis]